MPHRDDSFMLIRRLHASFRRFIFLANNQYLVYIIIITRNVKEKNKYVLSKTCKPITGSTVVLESRQIVEILDESKPFIGGLPQVVDAD